MDDIDLVDPTRDRQRGAVYLAEDQLARILASPSRKVRIGRRVLTLPEPLVFGDLDACRAFVASALAHPATAAAYPGLGPVLVEARGGFRQATYHPASQPGGGDPARVQPARIRIPAVDGRGKWAMAQTVVLHELAHHLSGGSGHGSHFREALVHLYSLHLGAPTAELLQTFFQPLADLPEERRQSESDPALRRVGALLAKATATQSEAEAQAYLSKATIIAAKHSVDLAVAALDLQGQGAGRPEPTHRMVTVGRPGAQSNKMLVELFVRLARNFGIAVDIGPRSTYLLAYGLPNDLDHLEAIFAAATAVMITQAGDHVRTGQWRGQQYAARDRDGRVVTRPVTARVARNAFYIGFIERVSAGAVGSGGHGGRDRNATPAAGQPDATRQELALRHKEVMIRDYHRRTTRARGTWRGSATTAGAAAGSRRAGQRAGEAFGRSGLPGTGRRALPG